MSTQSNQQCLDLQPRLAAFALGEIERDGELLAHLQGCPSCQRDMRAYARVARALPYEAPQSEPAAELRGRILAAVTQTAAPAPRPTRWWARPIGLPAFAAALAVIIALLGWNVVLQRQLDAAQSQVAASRAGWRDMTDLLNSTEVRWYSLGGASASGHFWSSPQKRVACLVAQGLPTLADEQVYQVWLVRGGQWTSVGMFEERTGSAWVIVPIDGPAEGYDAIEVTAEPAGGSTTPSGPPVLRGQPIAAHLPSDADRQLALSALDQARGGK